MHTSSSSSSSSQHDEPVLLILNNACSGGPPTCGQWYSSSSRSMRQPAAAPHFAAAAAAVDGPTAASAEVEAPNCTAGGWLMLRATGAWAGTLPCSQPPELLVRRTVVPQWGRRMQAPVYEPAAVLLLLMLPPPPLLLLALPSLRSPLQGLAVGPAAAAADITELARASRPASVTLTQKERCRQRRKGRRPTSARPPSAQHNGVGQPAVERVGSGSRAGWQ